MEGRKRRKRKMASLVNYLISLLMSFFMGVSHVDHEQDKIFLKENYYQAPVEEPDYLALYRDYENQGLSEGLEKCNTGKYVLEPTTSEKKIQDSSSTKAYLFYTTSETPTIDTVVSTANKDNDLGAYVFKVPKGTKIVAPYNCTLDNKSLTATDNMYPSDLMGKTMGSYIRVVTEETSNGQFRITFGSISRHWCCLCKSKPFGNVHEGDDTTPYYQHTYVPDRTFKFSAGDIIAEAGQSGVTKTIRTDKPSDAYIYIKVEKKVAGKSFVPVDIQELYKEGQS